MIVTAPSRLWASRRVFAIGADEEEACTRISRCAPSRSVTSKATQSSSPDVLQTSVAGRSAPQATSRIAAFLDALEFPWRLSLSYLAHLLYRTAHTAPNTQVTTTRRVPRDEPIPGCEGDREATFAPQN